jgi:hypothetical protein
MTMPKATRQQQLRRDRIDQRLVAFADELGVFVGPGKRHRAGVVDEANPPARIMARDKTAHANVPVPLQLARKRRYAST